MYVQPIYSNYTYVCCALCVFNKTVMFPAICIHSIPALCESLKSFMFPQINCTFWVRIFQMLFSNNFFKKKKKSQTAAADCPDQQTFDQRERRNQWNHHLQGRVQNGKRLVCSGSKPTAGGVRCKREVFFWTLQAQNRANSQKAYIRIILFWFPNKNAA